MLLWCERVVLMSLWKWRVNRSNASVMASYSEYKRQRVVSVWQDGYKAPKIAKLLAEENLPATQGVHTFLNKYEECGTISRQEAAGQRQI